MSCSWRLIIGWFVNQHIWVEMFHRQRWFTVMLCFQVSGVDVWSFACGDVCVICVVICSFGERVRRWKKKAYWQSDECQMNLTNQPKLPALPLTDQFSCLSLFIYLFIAFKMKTKSDRQFGCAALCLKLSTINSFKFILPTFWSTLAHGSDFFWLIFKYFM